MPTIKGVSGPYRLFFYSFDCNEPIHVHAERELSRVRAVVLEHAHRIRSAWDEHCPTS